MSIHHEYKDTTIGEIIMFIHVYTPGIKGYDNRRNIKYCRSLAYNSWSCSAKKTIVPTAALDS